MAVIRGKQAPSIKAEERTSGHQAPEISERANMSVTTSGIPENPGYLVDAKQMGAAGRLLSNAQHLANYTSENFGASADLWSMDRVPGGEKAWMVGGTSDPRTGKAFPTQLVDVGAPNPKLTAHDVLGTRDAMLPAARSWETKREGTRGYKNAIYGTWKDDSLGRVDVDLSTKFNDERQAEDMMFSRKEYAIYDNGHQNPDGTTGREITNQQARERRGLKVSPKDTQKDAKQEIIYSRHGDRQSDKG